MTHSAPEPASEHEAAPTVPVRIRAFALGDYQTNCYLLEAPLDADAPPSADSPSGWASWLIDCGDRPEAFLEAASALPTPPEAILLTHAHLDHIAGLFQARSALGPDVPIWIHTDEEHWLTDPMLNLSQLSGRSVTGPQADRLLNHGDRLALGGTEWEVRHTPGHSPGSISLWCERAGVVFAGDALFAGSIGRTDFPGSDHETLVSSIRTQLYTLPPRTVVLPGHGPATTIGHERLSNSFVRAE